MQEDNSIAALCHIERGSPVLVTGASGFTGSILTRKLVQAGLDVRALARPCSDLSALADLNIHWYRGEIFDKDIVADACREVRYIFHLAAAYRQAGFADQVYRDVHITGTLLLAEAALCSPHFRRFVHVSTVGVHGHIENPPADEDCPFSPGDIYQETKAEAEVRLRHFAKKSGLETTIIRPTAIYGPGDKRLLKVFKLAALPIFPLLGRGKCLYHLVHVEDLTNVLILAATHPAAAGEVFICGDREPISLEGMVQLIGATLGRQPLILRMPAWPFFLTADLCEAFCKPLGLSPPLYRRRVAFYTKDRAFDTHKLFSVLGYRPIYDPQRGLSETALWYIRAGWIRPKERHRLDAALNQR